MRSRPELRPGREEDPIADLLGYGSSRFAGLIDKLRRVIRETHPGLQEKALTVWKGIGYSDARAGYICAIFPQEDVVRLGFEWGVLLRADEGLLQGAGKQVRYLEFRNTGSLDIRVVSELVRQALALPPERSEKLRMRESIVDAPRRRPGRIPPT